MSKTIGFTCGAFDLFHAGHIAMLREAKTVCDWLIVGIQTDPTIDRSNKNKPIQSIIERQIQVAACRYVDETIVYETEEDLLILLKTLPINIRIAGNEYQNKDYTGRSLNIKTYFNKRDHTFSSTNLRNRVHYAECTKIKI
jgi:glycerol-3-phosphate cytidylyltransferase